MVAELTALRDQIDEVDKALLGLLAKRLELVAEVGEVKSQYGLPIYVPEREAAMLASRREEAALGVPPDLIEDVLRRVMRESYSSENDKGFKTLCPNLRPVVIVGGGGQMGRLFEKMLTLSGYQVRILEKDDWARARTLSPMPAWSSSACRFMHGRYDWSAAAVTGGLHPGRSGVGESGTAAGDAGRAPWSGTGSAPDVRAGQRQPGEAGGGLLRWSSAGGVSVVPGANSGLGRALHRISAVEHDQNMALFRRCATLRPLPTACIWRKRMFA
jgi:chorismate mutase/prephenate dehydrogenase